MSLHGVTREVELETEFNGKKQEHRLFHAWPVRAPRPVAQKLDPSLPFLTGMRILDVMFPLVMGGAAAIPGPFGSGSPEPVK